MRNYFYLLKRHIARFILWYYRHRLNEIQKIDLEWEIDDIEDINNFLCPGSCVFPESISQVIKTVNFIKKFHTSDF